MSSIAARISSQRQFAYFPHTSVSGETWQLIQNGLTTSDGAADGTTLIDTNNDSGAANAFNGRYWVRMLDTSSENEWCRVIDDDGAGTLTFENNGFTYQVTQNRPYQLWLSPEPVIVVDSSSDETDCVDAIRAEADDYWIDFYVVPITGNRRGRIAKVTDFVSATGTFTLESALGGALAAGDVCLLRRFVEVGDVNNGCKQAFERSPMDRLDGNIGDGRVLSRAGTFGFTTEVTSLAASSTSGTAARRPELGHMMQACGYKEIVATSSTLGAGSTTSAVKVATASWENHPIDSPVIYDGQLAWVVSTDDGDAGVDTLNIAPPFRTAPTSGQTIRGGVSYRRNRGGGSDGDYLGIGIEYEMDGIRYTLTGCRGNVTVGEGERLMLNWEMQVDHWVRQIERAPYYAGDAYTTKKPIRTVDRLCYIDTTKHDLGGLTASLNNEVAPKAVQGSAGINGRAGFAHVRAAGGGTFRQILSTDVVFPADSRFGARTSFAWSIIYGDSYQNMLGVRIPAARVVEDPTPEDADGMAVAPSVVAAHDPGTVTDGDSTLTRKADFIVAFG